MDKSGSDKKIKSSLVSRLGGNYTRLTAHRRFVDEKIVGLQNTSDKLRGIIDIGIIDVTKPVNNLITESEVLLYGAPGKQVEPKKHEQLKVRERPVYSMGANRWLYRLLVIHLGQKEYKQSELLEWLTRLYEVGALRIASTRVGNRKSKVSSALSTALNYAVKNKVLLLKKRLKGERTYIILNLRKLKLLAAGKYNTKG